MHEPVLVNEVIDLLNVKSGGTYVDGTVGSGGHTCALLQRTGPTGRVLGIDRDAEALARVEERLADRRSQIELAHGNFREMARIARERGLEDVDGIVLDVGVSSEQIDAPGRGMSFSSAGPLDMRMDRSTGPTAEDLVNTLPEVELAKLLFELGEERASRRIARAIVSAREVRRIRTTAELAETVAGAVGGRRGRLHPATRTFQALRIAVNDELGALAEGLGGALGLLADGGRMGVISFHSLEDRIVKRFFRAHQGRWESLAAGGREWVGEEPKVAILTRKPVCPSEQEVQRNPRARSAKLRVAERSSNGDSGK